MNNIPYENASTDENSGFSPTVAVLTVGPPDAGARPMFMKTKTGNIVTHKIALTSGSLCTLSGRTECRYRRSVPKDYGVKGDQFFIFFIQRTPDSSILSELMKIPIQHNGSPKSSICKNSSIYEIQEITKPLSVSDPESQRITDDQHVVSDNSATQNILKTPPTVKRTVPEPLQFVDAMDFEVDGGLLLAESLGTAVDNMDSETLTRELIRNHTSIAGNEDQKKARLQQRLSMTIGELTSTAANNSVNVAHLLSPTESVENFRQDLERVSNSQACIENTLTKVIESIVNIREDVTGIRANNVVLKDELSKPPPSQKTLPGIKELSHQVAECAAKIQQLNENIAAVREDLASVKDSVATPSTSTQDSLKDLHVWHNSAFSDEDSQRIKTVYDHILKYQKTADNIMYIKHATCQTEDDIDKQTMSLIPNEQQMEVEHTQSSEIPPEEQRQSRSVNRPSTFDWPDAMHLSLKTAVLSAKPIRVCLISDSIMRHITEFSFTSSQYRVHFDRIDRSNTEALGQERLRNTIKRKKPHVVIIHLGINDIQMGTPVGSIMNNIANFERFLEIERPTTKIIFSKPVLNGKLYQDRAVLDLRKSLERYRNTHDSSRKTVDQRLFTQKNDNFIIQASEEEACQVMRYHNQQDLLHLSQKGKDSIVCNVRHSLHSIFMEYVFNSFR